MRLLHTGDWHVGKRLRGRSRDDEMEAVLDQVVGIARDARVDAVLVAGDVFELRTSTPDSDQLVYDALVRLRDDGARVVVIPGNHDSWQRWEALARLLTPLGVTVVTKVLRPAEGGAVEVPTRDGDHAAVVACIPFVQERRFGDAAALFDDRASLFAAYDDGMGRVMAGMAAAFRPDRVNVLLAHVMMDGARTGGGEQELTIGMTYAVHPSRLPGTASYVALGHLHRPQAVPGAPCPARFAGSLIQLDFGEVEQDKSIVVVDAKPGKPPTVETVPVTAGRRLLDVEGTLEELAAKPESLGDAYLRVTVHTDGPTPGLTDRVLEILPNAVDVLARFERQDGEPARVGMRSLAPRDQFGHYYVHAHGVSEVPEELLAAFDRVHAEVAEGTG